MKLTLYKVYTQNGDYLGIEIHNGDFVVKVSLSDRPDKITVSGFCPNIGEEFTYHAIFSTENKSDNI